MFSPSVIRIMRHDAYSTKVLPYCVDETTPAGISSAGAQGPTDIGTRFDRRFAYPPPKPYYQTAPAAPHPIAGYPLHQPAAPSYYSQHYDATYLTVAQPIQPPAPIQEYPISLDAVHFRTPLSSFDGTSGALDTDRNAPRASVFVGQIPFRFVEPQVAQFIRLYGGATHVYHVKIVRGVSKRTGLPEPKGCAWVEIDAAEQQQVIENLHGCFLFTESELLAGAPRDLEYIHASLAAHTTKNLQRPVVCEQPRVGLGNGNW